MATYNVTTWEQFLRAFTIAHDPADTDNDVIEILADIDCNDVTITNPIYAGGIKTINGNNHTFYNLHDGTSTGSALIRNGDGNHHPTYAVTWNKLHFENMFMVLSSYGAFWGMNTQFMVFNDCTFVCRCSKEIFRFCTLNRCAITFENISTNNSPFEYGVLDIFDNILYSSANISLEISNPSFSTISTNAPLNECVLNLLLKH